ncbi:zinc-binding dehydrogenase [Archangium minus]|uniref:Zinc-binding dehydrogenase n=1 Tax=Archangium minus TaxID=83450 RepID=A0ABY9X949_9BACT|nr:zinc-binding dehydrogenase [Archangium minus]
MNRYIDGEVVIASKRGGPETLAVRPRRFDEPRAGLVRVAVEAAGVAYGDLLLREGLVPGAAFPVIPGYDAVGVVEALGADVTGVSVGDRVAVRTDGTGGYASHVEATPALMVPVPAALSGEVAVALVLNYTTAWQMLTRVAPVGAGGTVLVHGASGGVGGALAELARLRGLRVLGTASPSRLKRLEDRGVVPLDRSGDWAARARKLTPAGLDAVFDAEGGAVARRSLGLLGPGGHLVVYGASGSLRGGRRSLLGLVQMALTSPFLSALSLFIRGVGVSGYLSSSFVPARPAWFREDLTHLLELAARGEIAPAMGARLPLRDAPEAHRLLATGTAGKLVLLPGSAA